jgi:hypothetical protein
LKEKRLKTIFCAALLLIPCTGHAQTFTDNAGNYAPKASYAGLGGSTPGFGAFHVVTTTRAKGSAGTFRYTAAISEGNQGTAGDKPHTIDSPTTHLSKEPQSFGFYANGKSQGAGDPSVTITRLFKVPTQRTGLVNAGDTFSLDFVTGFNDGGTSGVALLSGGMPIGHFYYQAGHGFRFNGVATGRGYHNGALHLRYTLTSHTTYTLAVTGAVTFSGKGMFTHPITGFQVQQTNSAGTKPDHNGFFNNLKLITH